MNLSQTRIADSFFDEQHWKDKDRASLRRFTACWIFAIAWVLLSLWLSLPWLSNLGELSHPIFALFLLTFIAYVPGFMNAFLLMSLLLRPDPARRTPEQWPSISILIAAYHEEKLIGQTLSSVSRLDYPGTIEVIVLDDGSTDETSAAVRAQEHLFANLPTMSLSLMREDENRGKARVLNDGLAASSHELIVTIDADTLLQKNCLVSLVEHLAASPPGTVAVAGAVLTANQDESWIAAAQQWDYFHGIAAVKRMQGMFDGTLVAQGAFSIYRRDALLQAGGWPDTVGEDIVLTWGLLRMGYKIGYAEDAVAWTHAPATFRSLANQRKRWARGMIEALSIHRHLLRLPKMRTIFVWWNLLFVSIDLTFTLFFLPGLLLALGGIFWLAGPVTLLVLPLAALWNVVIYRIQSRMLRREQIDMEKSRTGFLLYVLIYPLLMQPVSVWGYVAELTGRKKQWNAI